MRKGIYLLLVLMLILGTLFSGCSDNGQNNGDPGEEPAGSNQQGDLDPGASNIDPSAGANFIKVTAEGTQINLGVTTPQQMIDDGFTPSDGAGEDKLNTVLEPGFYDWVQIGLVKDYCYIGAVTVNPGDSSSVIADCPIYEIMWYVLEEDSRLTIGDRELTGSMTMEDIEEIFSGFEKNVEGSNQVRFMGSSMHCLVTTNESGTLSMLSISILDEGSFEEAVLSQV